MKVLDLFAGTGSSTKAFEVRAHAVCRVEMDRQHEAEIYEDVGKLTPKTAILALWGLPDFIWASPPCQKFSIASVSHHWTKVGHEFHPKHPGATEALALVEKTLHLIKELQAPYWLIENPRGMLRKFPIMAPYKRYTVTYCQYGDDRMKPTDLWGVMPDNWVPRPMCRPGNTCHEAAPRGAKTGTQGRKGPVDRSRVPFDLSLEVCKAVEIALENGRLANPA